MVSDLSEPAHLKFVGGLFAWMPCASTTDLTLGWVSRRESNFFGEVAGLSESKSGVRIGSSFLFKLSSYMSSSKFLSFSN